MTNLVRSNFQAHPFHLVSPSPWPIFTCISLLALTTSGVLTMHGFSLAQDFLYMALLLVIFSMSFWFRDIISEATYLGNHTLAVQRGLNMGVALFIVSEALFFLAIFWTFFHSALSPAAEMGAQWPPKGIDSVNPFELPLLNTVILLSSGFTVTYAHHCLIQGNRSGALYGLVLTVMLALIFTGLQGLEYTVSSFTLSDSTYGSCFYFGTGFHGLNYVALYIIICIFLKTKKNYSIENNAEVNDKLLIHIASYKDKIANSYYLQKNFLEWFVGFTDAEGNFKIKITGLSENTFKNAQFTFQIGLHKDDESVLNYIMNTLNCGHISKSKDRVNYFVNDRNSLLHVILPIFDYVNLNSSKFHQFVLFKKAVTLVKDNSHLSNTGKLVIIQCKKEINNMFGKWIPSPFNSKITKFWLAGFIDGHGTFSTNKFVPRFKLENHIKELELYNNIKKFLNLGNLRLTSQKTDRVNSSPLVVLEVNRIKELIEVLIPLMYDSDTIILKSLKSKDFSLWLNLINIYYKGYHTIPEGHYLFGAIKLHINKYRLTTNTYLLDNMQRLSIYEIENLIYKLYLVDSPYVIKHGARYYRDTDKLVSEGTNIIVIDSSGKKTIHTSMTDCAKDLNIGRNKIKHCLISGEPYKGYMFVLG
uniref:Cytochrome c oxidase subunit 3 n=1 Tax=Bryoria tenuis TaxID=1089818 RepID=A0A1Y9TL52_9LECA|nr:cytochrome c oxidase subunit III [Bryoria tenuis]ARO90291.1 cytochrome c oxidase subunit III [Bryoria tenuis]